MSDDLLDKNQIRQSDGPLDVTVSVQLRQSEWAVFAALKGKRSNSAYLRERLNLDPPPSTGRRWPTDPTARHWRNPV